MEDMSELIKQFSTMLEKNEIPDNIKEIINNSNNSTQESSSNSENSNFDNFDISTFLKMQTIINNLNSNNDPRTNLLRSLKPYLKTNKQSQIDQYVQFLNMSKIFEIFKNSGGENK